MKVPNIERGIVPRVKIVGYLLSPAHPHGRHKAVFFARFGFQQTGYDVMAAALLQHAATHEVTTATPTQFGTTYTVEGPLVSPDGRDPWVRTVWSVAHGEAPPRFVSAYPLERRDQR